jgi:hypothetical protein
MKVGDLVQCTEDGEWGLVLRVLDKVEIPSLIEVMWSNNVISRSYQDSLEVVSESR